MRPADVFQLEAAYDPRISPDGEHVVYVRHSASAKDDRWHDELWCIDTRTGAQRPLTSGPRHDAMPRWSPDGTRIAYVSLDDGSPQIWVRWLDRGETARVTNIDEAPQSMAWSPDGSSLAFTAFVESDAAPFVQMPAAPDGATWSPAASVVTQVKYRA
ncbi:MAG: PD40 domain-containing protein, partial [Planctomycetes bacterium]|nr:PD40 domain-containing protein [Planctomycetota bacterium]